MVSVVSGRRSRRQFRTIQPSSANVLPFVFIVLSALLALFVFKWALDSAELTPEETSVDPLMPLGWNAYLTVRSQRGKIFFLLPEFSLVNAVFCKQVVTKQETTTKSGLSSGRSLINQVKVSSLYALT